MRKRTPAADVVDQLLEADDAGALAEGLRAVADSLQRVTPSAGAKARLLAEATSGANRFMPFFGRVGGMFDLDDAGVRHELEAIDDPSLWAPFPVPGVRIHLVEGGPRVAGVKVGLLWQDAGAHFPEHRHHGRERLLILQGALVDDQGARYTPGDEYDLGPGTQHAVTVVDEERCIAAVALSGDFELV